MNIEKIYKLSPEKIMSKFLRHYMRNGKYSVDERIMNDKILKIQNKIDELQEEKEAPMITRLKKESIIQAISDLTEEMNVLMEKVGEISNNRILLEEIYKEKTNKKPEINLKKSVKTSTMRSFVYGAASYSAQAVIDDYHIQPIRAAYYAIIGSTPTNFSESELKYSKGLIEGYIADYTDIMYDEETSAQDKSIAENKNGICLSALSIIEKAIVDLHNKESKKEEEPTTQPDQSQKEAEKTQDELSGYKVSKGADDTSILTAADGASYVYDPTRDIYINSDDPKKALYVVFDDNGNIISTSGADGSLEYNVINKDSSTNVETFDFAAWKSANNIPRSSQAPFDVRLRRTDMFVNGSERIPFSSDEASPVLSNLIDYAVSTNSKHTGHVVPSSKELYQSLINNSDLFGTLSLVNPYSVTRLYHGLDNIKISGKVVQARTNRMLDIRDQKRFYDIKSDSKSNDYLNVSNPSVNNIIRLMCNDRWGRTPYSYQDFVFCKYFGRIPNNRMITLRKYASPTYDNLCWELMGGDNNNEMKHKFAPIATCVTYFGGDSGNSLSDIFKIKTGLNWDKTKAEIWTVTGDAGETSGSGMMRRVEDIMQNGNNLSGTLGIISDVFPNIGSIGSKALSLAKFFGMAKSPNAFDSGAALAEKMYNALHDPNTNGPYANRIQGPLNRIDEVYKRKVGIKFENEITLKFAYKAHPIGGINTKAVMLDIISNLLTMCSATAVFWGGGHRFMIAPREYPWSSTLSPGIMKDIYNGKFFGQDGAIAKTLKGFMDAGGGGEGGWSWNTAMNALANLGMGVLGVLGGAVNTLLGSLSGQLVDKMQNAANQLLEGAANKFNGKGALEEGKKVFSNIMSNAQQVWRSNSIKESALPAVEGMRSILIGTPVGNWHLTVGNPLNPIAVIGNLICEDVTFKFGEEIGPDDFPTELEATITLHHGMARDLDAIESMFNRGAGRIYQAPDYARMFGGQVSSDAETRVDSMTGGTSARVPAAFTMVEDATALKYAGKKGAYDEYVTKGTTPSNHGHSDINLVCPVQNIDALDFDYGYVTETPQYSRSATNIRAAYTGNWATRKYIDS